MPARRRRACLPQATAKAGQAGGFSHAKTLLFERTHPLSQQFLHAIRSFLSPLNSRLLLKLKCLLRQYAVCYTVLLYRNICNDLWHVKPQVYNAPKSNPPFVFIQPE